MSLQPYKIVAIARTDAGGSNIIPNATVAIINGSGGYQALFESNLTTPIANPATADNNGELEAWIDPGYYTVTVSGGQSWPIVVGMSVDRKTSYADIRAIGATYPFDTIILSAEEIGGEFIYDSTDTTTPDDGWLTIVDSAGRRWKRQFSGGLHSEWLGMTGDISQDVTAELAEIASKCASTGKSITFKAGTYTYTSSPNWAIQGLRLFCAGEVIFNYTGAIKAFICDADATGASGPVSGLIYDVTVAGLKVQCPPGATHGAYFESIHHSDIDIEFLGGCSTGRAFEVGFSVVSEFKFRATVNDGGWFGGVAPATGLYLRQRGAGETPSYNIFENLILEGVTDGIIADHALGCHFLGGTSEGNSVSGVVLGTGATNNKFLGMDFEFNGSYDVLDNGKENEYHAIDSDSLVRFGSGARNCRLIGGSFRSIDVQGGATDCALSSLTYDRFNDGGTLTVSDDSTRLRDLYNFGTGITHDAVPASFGQAVGTSPYTYTNPFNNNVTVTVTGGGGVSLSMIRSGTTYGIDPTSGEFLLRTGDSIIITYSSAPTLRVSKG